MNNFIKNHLEKLQNNHFPYPDIELRALFNKTSKLKKEIIFSNFEIDQINLSLFQKAFSRRLANEPLAKIFNEKYFMEYSFYVDENVLDPRPETELIIDTAEKYFQDNKLNLKIVDLGTGSGCLAISLAKRYINSKITATDISSKALSVAKKNSKKLNTCNQIEFICCDWINKTKIFDVIVSNPPYLTINEYKNLYKGSKNYEPEIALLGGKDGLYSYRKLASIIPQIAHQDTLCFIEIGYNQKKECVRIFDEFGMYCNEIIADYQNHERIIVLKKKKISNKY